MMTMGNQDEAGIIRSYHDVEVEFGGKRLRLFDAGYGLLLTCNRASGWRLWNTWGGRDELLAGEYDEPILRIYVAGALVCGRQSASNGPRPSPAESAENGRNPLDENR